MSKRFNCSFTWVWRSAVSLLPCDIVVVSGGAAVMAGRAAVIERSRR